MLLVRNKSVTILFLLFRQLETFSVKFALLQRHAVKVAAGLFLFIRYSFVNQTDSMAASKSAEVQTRSSYMVTIAAPAVEVHLSANEHSRSVGRGAWTDFMRFFLIWETAG